MEILDIYDIHGENTGKTIVRGEKPKENEYIKLAIVYLKSKDKYLVQKCSEAKGGEYAITGGHVSSGNTSLKQCKIEVSEELGIDIDESKLKYLGHTIIRQAIFDIYLYEDDTLIDMSFTLQESEVECIEWLTKTEIEKLIEAGTFRKSSVAHYNEYIK